MEKITIIDYRPEHQPAFEALNRSWIEKYFQMEEMDVITLSNPDEAILQKGGVILIALYDGVVAGTVALLKANESTFRLAKMAVDEGFHRKGIAEALCKEALSRAERMGARRVILYSNSGLEPAIALYLKMGFYHLLGEGSEYRRANVKMEKWLTSAPPANEKVSIIRGNVNHAPAIAAVGRQSFYDAFGPLFNNKTELKAYLDRTYAISKIAESLAKDTNYFYVAVAGERPVGFVKLKTDELYPQIPSLSQMQLQKLYVLKEFHGSGAGAGLIQAAKDLAAAHNVEHLWLDTHVSNARGIRFYQKHGFKIYEDFYFTIGSQTFHYHLFDLELANKQTRPSPLNTNQYSNITSNL